MLEKNNTDIEDIVINMLSGEKLSPEEENVLTKIYGVPSCGPGRIWQNRTIATAMDWNAKKITNNPN